MIADRCRLLFAFIKAQSITLHGLPVSPYWGKFHPIFLDSHHTLLVCAYWDKIHPVFLDVRHVLLILPLVGLPLLRQNPSHFFQMVANHRRSPEQSALITLFRSLMVCVVLSNHRLSTILRAFSRGACSDLLTSSSFLSPTFIMVCGGLPNLPILFSLPPLSWCAVCGTITMAQNTSFCVINQYHTSLYIPSFY